MLWPSWPAGLCLELSLTSAVQAQCYLFIIYCVVIGGQRVTWPLLLGQPSLLVV